MKKLLFLLPFTTLLALPVQAITWDQFWRPFTYDRPYYRPTPYYYPSPYVQMCERPVYRQEWVPGNYWTPGYMRRWTENVSFPC